MREAPVPTLSVLVLNHNYAKYLPDCLDSILSQTFKEFELIVLDDASSDGSIEVAERYLSDPRVRLVRHETNRGYTLSLIEGTSELSRGEYLTVVSADDFVVDDQAFAVQIDQLRRNTRLVACFTAFTKIGPGIHQSIRRPLAADAVVTGPELITRQLCDREFAILHSGTIIKASAYRDAGGYRADLRNYVDLAMWFALGRLGPVAYVDRPLYAYRIHPTQLSGSASNRRTTLREGLRLLKSTAREAQRTGIDVTVGASLRARVADLALADAFANRRRVALLRCFDGLLIEPVAAVASWGWWMALTRASVGARVWSLLARARQACLPRRANSMKTRSHRTG